MILFLLMNIFLFVSGVYLVFQSMLHYSSILALPAPLIIVYVIGLITPVLNIYDVIKNAISIGEAVSFSTKDDKDEDSM